MHSPWHFRDGDARHVKEADSHADREEWEPFPNRAWFIFRTALPRWGCSGDWRDLARRAWRELVLSSDRQSCGSFGSSSVPGKAPRLLPLHRSLHHYCIVVVVGGWTEWLGVGTPSRGTRHLDGWCLGSPSHIADSQSNAYPKYRPRELGCFWCRPLFR